MPFDSPFHDSPLFAEILVPRTGMYVIAHVRAYSSFFHQECCRSPCGCQQTVADGFRRVQFFAVRRGGKKFPYPCSPSPGQTNCTQRFLNIALQVGCNGSRHSERAARRGGMKILTSIDRR